MRYPDELESGDTTTFVVEGIDLTTIHERHWFKKLDKIFEPGHDIVHALNPRYKDYVKENNLLQRFTAWMKRDAPPMDIWMSIPRGKVDFNQNSEVVFTVTPIEEKNHCYEVVSHTVKKGKTSHPPIYTALHRELLDTIIKPSAELLH